MAGNNFYFLGCSNQVRFELRKNTTTLGDSFRRSNPSVLPREVADSILFYFIFYVVSTKVISQSPQRWVLLYCLLMQKRGSPASWMQFSRAPSPLQICVFTFRRFTQWDFKHSGWLGVSDSLQRRKLGRMHENCKPFSRLIDSSPLQGSIFRLAPLNAN